MKRAGKKRITTVAVVGVLAAFAAGCGSSGGGGGGTLSKADYAKKLGVIANEVKSLQSVGTSGGSAASKYKQLRDGMNKAADELRVLLAQGCGPDHALGDGHQDPLPFPAPTCSSSDAAMTAFTMFW